MDLMQLSCARACQRLAAIACLGLIVGTTLAAAARSGVAATGEEVYAAQKCSQCHSVEGKGNKKYPLDGVGSRLSEGEIREWLSADGIEAEELEGGKTAWALACLVRSAPN